ncbi:HTH-type transcriptional regulator BhcR [Chelatococcus asaccharovorans]|jgi:IclR family acetate operon transcriptional repressor|uniref:IclR family transcriptional regulator n=1 Tax=Chelatococcus asaccharovorans TaxID=28210 RepID=A0A2V3TTC5_9HYPH|nr:HTH-type transcriptional regulator BhcR [Chelatococcus asaccharovorans]MBS7708093.1 IclR family transcriptional regulator [Chelatococcus asaccharovorans]PXW51580.1 IclR family transcriptional regulator [Chelatococcus asaccharovorans]
MQRPIRKRGRPKGSISAKPAIGIQALDRGLDVLEALASHEGVTLTGLADYLDQSPATMHRVLATLKQRGYVEANTERQEWYVGPEAFRLGSAFLRRTNLVERSRSVMRDLMIRTGETSNLGIERDGDVLFVSQVETHETIRAFFPPGMRSPLHASGIGKALLSAFDDDRLEAFLKTATFTRFTDKTMVNAEELRESIRLTRRRGYSVDDEERTTGMRCVAASIANSYGEAVAGISISGPTIRMSDEKLHEIGRLVAAAAAEVSARLGAR